MASKSEVVRNVNRSFESQPISPSGKTVIELRRGSNKERDTKGKGRADSTYSQGKNGDIVTSARRESFRAQGLQKINGKGKVEGLDDTKSDDGVKRKVKKFERLVTENVKGNNHSETQAKERTHKSSGQHSATSTDTNDEDDNNRDANGEARASSLIHRTDKIEEQIGAETNRSAKIRKEVDEMKTELEYMRSVKAIILDDMGDHSVTEENFERLKSMHKRLETRYELSRSEIESLEEQLKAANSTIKILEVELEKVRKDLHEEKKKSHGLEMNVIDLNKKIKTLEQQLASLQAEWDEVMEALDSGEPALQAFRDISSSTPTSNEASLKTPEDGSVDWTLAVAGSSRSQATQIREERVDRDGSPFAPITGSDAGAPLVQTPTDSSRKSSKEKPRREAPKSSIQTQKYPSVLGYVISKTETMRDPEGRHHRNSSSRRKASRPLKDNI